MFRYKKFKAFFIWILAGILHNNFDGTNAASNVLKFSPEKNDDSSAKKLCLQKCKQKDTSCEQACSNLLASTQGTLRSRRNADAPFSGRKGRLRYRIVMKSGFLNVIIIFENIDVDGDEYMVKLTHAVCPKKQNVDCMKRKAMSNIYDSNQARDKFKFLFWNTLYNITVFGRPITIPYVPYKRVAFMEFRTPYCRSHNVNEPDWYCGSFQEYKSNAETKRKKTVQRETTTETKSANTIDRENSTFMFGSTSKLKNDSVDYKTNSETKTETTVQRETNRETKTETTLQRETNRETKTETTVQRETNRETKTKTTIQREKNTETKSSTINGKESNKFTFGFTSKPKNYSGNNKSNTETKIEKTVQRETTIKTKSPNINDRENSTFTFWFTSKLKKYSGNHKSKAETIRKKTAQRKTNTETKSPNKNDRENRTFTFGLTSKLKNYSGNRNDINTPTTNRTMVYENNENLFLFHNETDDDVLEVRVSSIAFSKNSAPVVWFEWTCLANGTQYRVYKEKIISDETETTHRHIYEVSIPRTDCTGSLSFDSYFNYSVKVVAFLDPKITSNTLIITPAMIEKYRRKKVTTPGELRLKPGRTEEAKLKGWLMAVAAIAGVVIAAVIAVIVYCKWKSLKDVRVARTFPLQCNNYMYKSATYLDVKGYYTNELQGTLDGWEIDAKNIQFISTLGQGAFGKVMTAFLAERRVAVKVVREGAPITYKEDLLAEIDLMKRIGCHPHIVSLIGCCTLREPIALVMEYVPYGNLQTFLKKCRLENELRRMEGAAGEITYHMVDAHGSIEEGIITPADILTFARQIVMAMEYLSEKSYVHRDLAARNVLLDYNKVVKVCDFGLSRDVFNSDNQYKKLTSGKLPLKWMALESLRDRVFTSRSDVWSFGILLWEIVTMGASPYPHIALADLFYMLTNGFRMDKPSNCSDDLYIIMRWCWAEEPRDRPNFTQLREHIDALLTTACNYLDLECINVPLSTETSTSSGEIERKEVDDMKASRNSQTSTQPLLSSDSSSEDVRHDIKDLRRRLDEMKDTCI